MHQISLFHTTNFNLSEKIGKAVTKWGKFCNFFAT